MLVPPYLILPDPEPLPAHNMPLRLNRLHGGEDAIGLAVV